MSDTIVALGSGRPPAGIAVLRLSGPAAGPLLEALTGRALPPPRRLLLRPLHHPGSGALLDRALVVFLPGPATATGEDMAELHLHGGSAVVAGVLEAACAHPGVRLAEAGEFTRRGFDNGRLDLSEVEGLADLIGAETESQRSQALALAGGALGRLADSWRDRCLTLLADAEAGLDFAEDEADVAARLDQAAAEALTAMATELEQLVADSGRAARLRDGLVIVVSGPPNVGKSSLVNALAMRDMAMVTPHAGTTRDLIEVPLNLGGMAAVLIDTAGLRDTDDPVEAQGIARARARAASADLVLHLRDQPDAEWPATGLPLLGKLDLHGGAAPAGGLALSATTGAGISALRAHLARWAETVLRPGEPALLAHARHRDAFAEAARLLREGAEADLPELRAESLRLAARAMGRVTGRVDVEALLGQIFSRFCIGK